MNSNCRDFEIAALIGQCIPYLYCNLEMVMSVTCLIYIYDPMLSISVSVSLLSGLAATLP
jgi:hypothetical protein